MDLSIIIVSWNVREQLRACLQSIQYYSENYNYEVIVVDNASQDGSADMVTKHFPQVKLIRNPQNKGFAAANNQALALATGKYTLCLNDDCVFISDMIGSLLNTMPHVNGLLGVQLQNTDGTIQPSVRRFPSVWDQTIIQLKLHHLFPKLIQRYLATDFDYTQPAIVDQVMGAVMCIATTTFKQLGGFDEAYFVWFEEVDLQLKLNQAGYSIHYEPSIQCRHAQGQSFQQLQRPAAQRLFNRSLRTYMYKHHGMAAYLWFTALYPISMLLAYVTQVVR